MLEVQLLWKDGSDKFIAVIWWLCFIDRQQLKVLQRKFGLHIFRTSPQLIVYMQIVYVKPQEIHYFYNSKSNGEW